jgi:branched-chain amino acid transport system permease protein
VIEFADVLNFNFIASNLVFIGIFLVLTLSLNLINGCAGMFSLGHQGFWAVGAYAAGAVIVHGADVLPGGVLFALSLLAGVVIAGLAGLVVGIPCLRLRGDYLAIATLGFAEITRVLLNNIEWLGGSRGLRVPAVVIAKTPDTAGAYYAFYLALAWSAALLTLVFCRNLLRSRDGRAVLSLREDEVAAEQSGVPLARYKILTFVSGACFAGLAGGIYASFFGVLSPKDFGVMSGIMLLLMVVVGGSGSLSGTVLATMLLYVAQQLFKLRFLGLPSALAESLGGPSWVGVARTFEEVGAEHWQLFFAVLLVALMIAAPHGLLGKGELRDTRWYRRLASLRGGRKPTVEAP